MKKKAQFRAEMSGGTDRPWKMTGEVRKRFPKR
jgi:hypothetical protein